MADEDLESWCPTWGSLRDGNKSHMDCLVVVDESNRFSCADADQLAGKTLPIVCPCECWTCKRAWSADGMPIVRDGKVVRHP